MTILSVNELPAAELKTHGNYQAARNDAQEEQNVKEKPESQEEARLPRWMLASC